MISRFVSAFSCSADIALIGLAVMGQNLILNMNDHGFVVSGSPCTASLEGAFVSARTVNGACATLSLSVVAAFAGTT